MVPCDVISQLFRFVRNVTTTVANSMNEIYVPAINFKTSQA